MRRGSTSATGQRRDGEVKYNHHARWWKIIFRMDLEARGAVLPHPNVLQNALQAGGKKFYHSVGIFAHRSYADVQEMASDLCV